MQIDHMTQSQNIINKNTAKINVQNQKEINMFDTMLKPNINNKISEEKTESPLKNMIQTVEDLKQNLDYEVTVENLEKYKEAVQEFLEYYTKNEMKMEDFILKDERGYQKKLSIIKTIDEKMNDMNYNMLESPLGHIEILKQTGEINGLILDLSL